MSTANYTDTIRPSGHRSPSVYLLALAWFASRQVAFRSARGVDLVLAWAERSRQRRQLAELDDYMLCDIGLTRADVSHELRKSFWQQ
jgi:uncharacterized protein YjiS (DUF1127 family)